MGSEKKFNNVISNFVYIRRDIKKNGKHFDKNFLNLKVDVEKKEFLENWIS